VTSKRPDRNDLGELDMRARIAALETTNTHLTAKVASLSFLAAAAARVGATLDPRVIAREVIDAVGVATNDRNRPRFLIVRNGNDLECGDGTLVDQPEAEAFVSAHHDVLERSLRIGEVARAGGFAVIPIPVRANEPGFGCIVVLEPADDPLDQAQLQLLVRLAELAGRSFANARLLAQSVTAGVTDELTGVYNRRYFDRRLAEELKRARRLGERMGLILLDLDLFKSINDRFGHPEGDRTLRAAANSIVASVRDIDAVTRWGGEEFAVILPGADGDHAVVVAERIREAVEALRLRTASGVELGITVSCGVAWVAPDIHTPAQCLAAADRCLLEAKRAGRNRTIAMADPAGEPIPGRSVDGRESVPREHRGAARNA
jgi:diguanylate cyclase (GGDEF)-like protein